MNETKAFDDVLYYLPEKLSRVLADMPADLKAKTNEIRLRAGKPLVLCGVYGCCFPFGKGRYSFMSFDKAPVVTASDVEYIVVSLCSHSVYSHQDEINSGFISFGNGCRAGVCGTAVTENGKVKNVKNFTSVNIRIAKNIDGAGQLIYDRLFVDSLKNTVIFGAPLTGKTTILKSLAEILSSSPHYYRTVVIDERAELNTCRGTNLDVFTSYPKATAIEQSVRAFAPQIILADEIGTDKECDAIISAMDCGAKFITSVHCGELSELLRRPLCKKMIACGSFEYFVELKKIGDEPQFYKREALYDQIYGNVPDLYSIGAYRDGIKFKNEHESIGA